MKFLVVGCGMVGSEIVRDLSASKEVDEVVVTDVKEESLARVKKWTKVKTVRTDLHHPRTLTHLVKAADVVCGALPGRLGFQLMKMAVSLCRDIVDISYTREDPFELHQESLANHCVVVPQCGVAPGFTNMCVGDATNRLDSVRGVRIYVGGIPQKPVPPLNYRLVFSLEDVINEYTRPVRVVENGKQKVVNPLSGRGVLDFPGAGRLEYFLTDGLGTLPKSFRDIRNMHELTLRYPGHVEIIHALKSIGYFESKPVRVDGTEVEPRRLTMELLRSAFNIGTPEDMLAFRVDVEGYSHRTRVLVRYQMLDRFNRKNKVSAMARTTAYPCTSLALLVASGKIRARGVVPPENVAQNTDMFRYILSRLRARGIVTTIQTRTLGS